MKLAETSVRRPVLASVLSLLVLLVGLMAYQKLPVREYPRIDEPIVRVTVVYEGASAEVMESQVTKPLEDSIAGIDGMDVIESITRAGSANIMARFHLEKDADVAASDVRDRVARVRGRLPDDIEDPIIAQADADAEPVLVISVTSDERSGLEITELINNVAKPRLQTADGVSDVIIYGERKYAMRVWLDPVRLASYQLTVQDVEDALRASNLEVPAGRIESSLREFDVTSRTTLATPEQFGAVVLKTVRGAPVHLADVAHIYEGPANTRVLSRLNGRLSISMALVAKATANPLDLSRSVMAMLPEVQRDLPDDVRLSVARDNSVFIQESIKAVYLTIAEAVALVALVIFVFLRTLRASIIPIVTIPVSLIGAFALMAAFGFSINTLTLLALVLAIGLVVDDAIVVLENIWRHIEDGMDPFAAAITGVREIAFAVVAMTLTLVAVFAPLAFTPGRTGRLFTEFALALAGAVLVSGFVALTLAPMLSSKLLRHNDRPSWFDRSMSHVLNGLSAGYGKLLRWVLTGRVHKPAGAAQALPWWRSGRPWVLLLMLGCMGASALLYPTLRQELSPVEDRGLILIPVTAPDGASLAYTARYVEQIEEIGASFPEFDRVQGFAGRPTVAQGTVALRTVDWDQRQRGTPELASLLQGELQQVAGVNAFAITPPSLGQGGRERPVNFVVMTSHSYEDLAEAMDRLMAEVEANPGFIAPELDLRLNKPDLSLNVDRQRAADLGVRVGDVARAVETMLGGRTITRYQKGADQYDVMVQIGDAERRTPQSVDDIYVRGRGEAMVPLASVVQIKEGVSPRELRHFGQRRAAAITANLAPDYSQGQALADLRAAADRVLDSGYATDVRGSLREFVRSQGALTLVFLLALAFIYLVLAAQFESFVDPFIILLAVPLSLLGALLALRLTGGSLNVYSQIGLITLVGLISKHGILIVEFSNQLRERGQPMTEALITASTLRLRPILMTTGAMVLGALPLALATGAGSESRQQIGWVIVGGMSLGTLLTVFVVPTVYALLARPGVPGAIRREVPQLDEPGLDGQGLGKA